MREVPELHHLADVDSARGAAVLRPRGVYLVTGASGRLAKLLAEYLAREWSARLVLVGRSPASALRAHLDRLKALGGSALYVEADVARRHDVARAVRVARASFGSVNGVFHVAGATRDGLIWNKDVVTATSVLQPKMAGALYLDIATRREPLDLFVEYSSLAGVTGNVGQCDYAFANAYLDAFADLREGLRRRGRRSGKTISIAWPLWENGGMSVDDGTKRRLRDAGLGALPDRAGTPALLAGLSAPAPLVVVVHGQRAVFERVLRIAPEVRAESQRAAAHPPALEAATVTGRMRASLVEGATSLLVDVISEETKLEPARIQRDRPLEEYGIESVAVLAMTERLERTFGALPKTLFFEFKTVRALAEHFADAYPAKLAEVLGVSGQAAAARGDERVPAARVVTRAAPAVPPPPPETATSRGGSPPDDAVAIIGLKGRYPQAPSLEALWENLRSGRDCVTEVPAARWDASRHFDAEKGRPGKTYGRWGGFLDDVDAFDALFFGISPKEAELMDPQERLFCETAWETFEDAGYARAALAGRRVGVFVGAMWSQYQLWYRDEEGAAVAPRSSFASIANRVSYLLGLTGPSLAVDTMCSSSLTALHLACESIRRGECDLALAGGVNLSLHPSKYVQLAEGRFLSSDGRCRSFAAGADGYVPAEAVGAVLLKPLARAIEDGDQVYAVVRATHVGHGGRSNGYGVPDPGAQGALVAEALAKANVDPRTVGYVEAQGIGSALGDPIEIAGLQKAFGTGRAAPCAIGSIKSNIGHAEAAAGIAGVTKVVLQLQHRTLVPSLHAETPNPHIDFDAVPFRVQRELSGWSAPEGAPRRACVSAFGAGGANAHVVLEEHVEAARPGSTAAAGPQLLVLSARTRYALGGQAARLGAHLSAAGDAVSLADVAFTLQVGREPMRWRLAVIATSVRESVAALERAARDPVGAADGRTVFARDAERASDLRAVLERPLGASLVDLAVARRDVEALGELWTAGASVEWRALHDGRRRLPLPTYPFERSRYWVGRTAAAAGAVALGPERAAPPASSPDPLADDAIEPVETFIRRSLALDLKLDPATLEADRDV
ncbi:MAG TPA: type I polyketide synthase, partial [Anaeromyxobacter sp.]|nr:type I polyketide synthase [Anaeromyxobacter sp.]